MRILVAEDDAILADGVAISLRQSGYAVDWVKNGLEADSALEADDPYLPYSGILRVRRLRCCMIVK